MNKQQREQAKRKQQRKLESAIKKKKQSRIVMIVIIIAIIAVIAGLIGFNAYQASKDRVFASDEGQTVTLHDNGKFTARLAHGTGNGTYTEKTEDGVTTVTFIYGGESADGRIEGGVLTVPEEWDDGHGHGDEFVLRGGSK